MLMVVPSKVAVPEVVVFGSTPDTVMFMVRECVVVSASYFTDNEGISNVDDDDITVCIVESVNVSV